MTANSPSFDLPLLLKQDRARSRIQADSVLKYASLGGAICILLMLAGLISVLVFAAAPAIKTFGASFLVSSDWRPNELQQPRRGPDGKILIEDGETVMETIPPSFGALPVIYGTAVSSALITPLRGPAEPRGGAVPRARRAQFPTRARVVSDRIPRGDS